MIHFQNSSPPSKDFIDFWHVPRSHPTVDGLNPVPPNRMNHPNIVGILYTSHGTGFFRSTPYHPGNEIASMVGVSKCSAKAGPNMQRSKCVMLGDHVANAPGNDPGNEMELDN